MERPERKSAWGRVASAAGSVAQMLLWWQFYQNWVVISHSKGMALFLHGDVNNKIQRVQMRLTDTFQVSDALNERN